MFQVFGVWRPVDCKRRCGGAWYLHLQGIRSLSILNFECGLKIRIYNGNTAELCWTSVPIKEQKYSSDNKYYYYFGQTPWLTTSKIAFMFTVTHDRQKHLHAAQEMAFRNFLLQNKCLQGSNNDMNYLSHDQICDSRKQSWIRKRTVTWHNKYRYTS